MSDFFEGKQFYVFVFAWFVLSYLILWFFGGACTDILSGGTCFSSQALSGLSNVFLVNLLLPFNQWFSMMYWFAPVAGFVFAFFGIKWYNEYFESKFAASAWIFPLLLVALFAGYYINLSWYYGEGASLNSNDNVSVGLYFCLSEVTDAKCNEVVGKINQELINQAQNSGASKVQQFIPVRYWSELKESIYLTFILGAIAGWLPLFLKNFFSKKEEKI